MNPFYDARLIALGRQMPEVPGKKKWDLKLELMKEMNDPGVWPENVNPKSQPSQSSQEIQKSSSSVSITS